MKDHVIRPEARHETIQPLLPRGVYRHRVYFSCNGNRSVLPRFSFWVASSREFGRSGGRVDCGSVRERKQDINHAGFGFRAHSILPASFLSRTQLVEYAFGADNLSLAQRVMRVFEQQPNKTEAAQPYLTMARFLIDRGLLKEASEVLKNTPESRTAAETLESAILKKRAGDLRGAHHLFAAAYALTPDDSKIIHEFAQTKLGLAGDVRDPQLRKRLNREAVELLRRAIQLADNNVRRAWCWFDLARALNWLKSPKSEVEGAILQARSLLPDEHRFKEWHERWKQQKN